MKGIRLQLLLAKAGIASRRHAETLISEGHVAVNGRIVTQLGTCVDPVADRISVDGKPVEQEPLAYFLLHKPKGYVTTASDPDGRPTVFDLMPEAPVRLFPVGRLDYNTEGVLLLTNDGELAHALMHPSRGVEKVYHAKFREELTSAMISRLQQGVDLPPARPLGRDGQPLPVSKPMGPPERSAPAEVRVLKFTSRHTWAEIRLHEGKNRQIHRMAEAVGSSLLKLVRVEYAGLTAAGVELGNARPLSRGEVSRLRLMCGLSATLPRAAHSTEEREPSRPFGRRPSPRGFSDRPDDRPPSRRYEDKPAPRRFDDRPPARKYEDKPTARRYEDKPAARRSDDRSSPRQLGDRPAPRRFDDRPPARKYEDKPAPRRFDDRPPARKYEDKPAPRRFDDTPPARKYDDKPAPRRFEDKPAPRRTDERPAPRRFDEKPTGRAKFPRSRPNQPPPPLD